MKFKKTRIALSALCGTSCLLLIALWVRSRSVRDDFHYYGISNASLCLGADNGSITVVYGAWQRSPVETTWEYQTRQSTIMPLGFQWFSKGRFTNIFIPIWCPLVCVVASGAMPWIPWPRHFSLRTLFILMTLASLLLGLIVYSTQSQLLM